MLSFIYNEHGKLAHQDLLSILGAPDKLIGMLVGDVFGVLCIHTRQFYKCSNSCRIPVWAAFPLDEWLGYPAALS